MAIIGSIVKCPNCAGLGVEGEKQKKCSICNGTGRVEYQERLDWQTAPAGSWLPAKRRGKTGSMIVIFGGAKTEGTR